MGDVWLSEDGNVLTLSRANGAMRFHGIWLRDVGITNNSWGRPLVIWSERGQRVCERLGIGDGHVSLTDDAGLVMAFAVCETRLR